MPSPYPYELSARVISALESKMSVSKIMKVFKICRDAVYKWKNIHKTTSDVMAPNGCRELKYFVEKYTKICY